MWCVGFGGEYVVEAGVKEWFCCVSYVYHVHFDICEACVHEVLIDVG